MYWSKKCQTSPRNTVESYKVALKWKTPAPVPHKRAWLPPTTIPTSPNLWDTISQEYLNQSKGTVTTVCELWLPNNHVQENCRENNYNICSQPEWISSPCGMSNVLWDRELRDLAHLIAVHRLRFGWWWWRFDRLRLRYRLEQLPGVCRPGGAVIRFAGLSGFICDSWRHLKHGGHVWNLVLSQQLNAGWCLDLHLSSNSWDNKGAFQY